jgi:hypothetical protein
LIRRELLVRKDEYHPVEKGAPHLLLLLGVEWLREIESPDLCTDVGRQRRDLEAVVLETAFWNGDVLGRMIESQWSFLPRCSGSDSES